MKTTGPTKEKTKKTIALLEKTARKSKSAIWLDLANRLKKPRRQKQGTNLWKIEKLAAIFPEKNITVPGKILAKGEIAKKANVIAFQYSKNAKEKIEKAGGKAITIEEAIQQKTSPKTMVIAK